MGRKSTLKGFNIFSPSSLPHNKNQTPATNFKKIIILQFDQNGWENTLQQLDKN